MRGKLVKRQMCSNVRSSFASYLIILTLVFLVYFFTVLPPEENVGTKESHSAMLRALFNTETPQLPSDDVENNLQAKVAGFPVKLKPRFVSDDTVAKFESKHSLGLENEETGFKTRPLISRDDFQEDYMGFINYASDADLQNSLLNKHKFKFLVENKFACRDDVFLLVLIHSAANKYKERDEIRNTWAAVRVHNGAYIVPLFLLAKPSGNTTLNSVLKESRTYRDIVIGDFIDHYKNLTYKNVMGLYWTTKNCNQTKFVLKTDDDTMVDMYHLISFLVQKSPDGVTENFMYCSTFRNQGPVRRPSDKWFVTLKEYPYTKYPPYCEGFAYVMSMDVVRKLYEASKFVPFYWIDDVYVTGFLMAKAGLYHHDMENGHSYNLMQSEHLSKHVQSSIFLLAKYPYLRKNWGRAWNDILAFNRITN